MGQNECEPDVVANNINPQDFELEKRKLKQAVENFLVTGTLITENKLAGKFSRNDWGKLTYNHMDHHLRQFDV